MQKQRDRRKLGITARVERDSISPRGHRLTTFVIHLPRFVLAEFNTHRVLSRNTASSRAVPVRRKIQEVLSGPFVPIAFGANKGGMQAAGDLPPWQAAACRWVWLLARYPAVLAALVLVWLGLHKQWANRLLEPWGWVEVVATATEWDNFFALRTHAAAQPEMRKAAQMMYAAYLASTPEAVGYGQWHLPFTTKAERDFLNSHGEDDHPPYRVVLERLRSVSAGRLTRVSFETHDGRRDDTEDVALAIRMEGNRPVHASPFEHMGTPLVLDDRALSRNFSGWKQYRAMLAGETVRTFKADPHEADAWMQEWTAGLSDWHKPRE